jgi:hypothetical protein
MTNIFFSLHYKLYISEEEHSSVINSEICAMYLEGIKEKRITFQNYCFDQL